MNIKEYIESGILEQYAMGLCSADEMRNVQRMAAEYAEVRLALLETEVLLKQYAEADGMQPSARVKAGVMAHIAAQQKPETKVVNISTRSSYSWLAAASIALLITSGILNFVQYRNNNSLTTQLAEARDKNVSYAADMELTRANYAATEKLMAFVNHSATKKIPLNGTATHEDMLATVYWNSLTKEVYLGVNNMPEPPHGHQYQLWAIVDGAPVNAGMLNMQDTTALHKMVSFDSPGAFAITVEKEGGSTTPTLTSMVVIGGT
ncbi:MAG: anti-sigma factor domain-containing protein [Flavobacteriales bacterium]